MKPTTHAVSAYTQVRMKEAPRTLRSFRRSDFLVIVVQQTGTTLMIQMVPVERHLYGHPCAGLYWERILEGILLNDDLGISSKAKTMFNTSIARHSCACLCTWTTSTWCRTASLLEAHCTWVTRKALQKVTKKWSTAKNIFRRTSTQVSEPQICICSSVSESHILVP